MRQLNGAQIDSPPDELINLITGMALDTDTFVRMTAANFLGSHGTTNQVPVLLKLLKDTDWGSRQAATKALGRLKDERAIIPLTDAIAQGGSSYGQDASAALINIGQPAETAVLALLNERNFDTRRQACTILQHIGTNASLAALENQVGESDQSLSQAAMEAIHQIKMRQ
jgi:HEAT repeat protein